MGLSNATQTARIGTAMALLSAAAFGSSGPMAKALIDAGWTAGAVVLVRLGGAAVILVIAAAVALRGRWHPSAAGLRTILLYGVVAMAGVQLAFFNAVRTLDVGVALMIEYLAPLLLLAWTTLRRRAMPPLPTLLGAALALVGLVFVLDPSGSASLDPVGVAWAAMAAVGLAAFFVISNHQHTDLPPLVMAAGGTTVGAIVVAVAGGLNVVPLAFTASDAWLGGAAVTWLVPAASLVVIATLVGYLSGIGGIIRLGTRSASFLALAEVLFAVLFAWFLLAEVPTTQQLLGGAAIIAGIVVIRRQELVAVPASGPVLEPAT